MRIRQIVLAAQDLPAARGLLAQVLQLPRPFRDPGVAEFGIDNAVFTFGDQFIEVISPTRADSACARHLARQGDGGYMLILQTDDFQREQAHWAALGVRTVWTTRFDDISAAHLHPKDVGAAIVSVDQPRPPASWRWGGPQWRVQPGPLGGQRVRGITLRAADPQALARRWAQVFARPEPLRVGAAWRVLLDDGFADVVDSAGQPDGVQGFTLAVADPGAVLQAASAAGLAVAGRRLQLLGAQWQIEALQSAAA